MCLCRTLSPSHPIFLGLLLALRLWKDQQGSSPLAESTRQQPVGRINQVADRGDEDRDEDEIPSHAVSPYA